MDPKKPNDGDLMRNTDGTPCVQTLTFNGVATECVKRYTASGWVKEPLADAHRNETVTAPTTRAGKRGDASGWQKAVERVKAGPHAKAIAKLSAEQQGTTTHPTRRPLHPGWQKAVTRITESMR